MDKKSLRKYEKKCLELSLDIILYMRRSLLKDGLFKEKDSDIIDICTHVIICSVATWIDFCDPKSEELMMKKISEKVMGILNSHPKTKS